MHIAIIGAGISGLSIAQMLNKEHHVTVYEAAERPGGLIRCDIVDGSLFHRTGGHVFNTKNQAAADFFWSFMDKDSEFTLSPRHAAVDIPGCGMVDYPIENHIYQLNDETLQSFIDDLATIMRNNTEPPRNFAEFLRKRFGDTLYDLYFEPYNRKVWRRDLTKVPLSWLEGKLPMPTPEEMIYNNIRQVEERQFVHSTFYYPRQGGSQLIADRMANGLDIRYNTPVTQMQSVADGNGWMVNGRLYDRVVFCGNIKQLPAMLGCESVITPYAGAIEGLEYHGTTAVFCEIDANPYSWLYQPSTAHDSHRIICTGNFSKANNSNDTTARGRITATVEFTDEMTLSDIQQQLDRLPFKPRYLTHHYEKYTYPIQDSTTRDMITILQGLLNTKGLYLLGRFAQWEYYNMDAAIGAAQALFPSICK